MISTPLTLAMDGYAYFYIWNDKPDYKNKLCRLVTPGNGYVTVAFEDGAQFTVKRQALRRVAD